MLRCRCEVWGRTSKEGWREDGTKSGTGNEILLRGDTVSIKRTGSVMVGRKHCVWFCCDIVVGTVTFQSSCGRKVNILDAESYYVMGIGVQV